ncbi:ThuA domain-containing protein [Spirosoma validum]|uniref:ThuA domain-containing protein n=1 Tax=Spirosoma validum TaxID=2771355 RepID=A0A927B034_9BACT|nr:ThuA domain-containing protein [Spirosoma validum]MBD2753051.1 ThuA domain-containing protein [Spirosoma validum]
MKTLIYLLLTLFLGIGSAPATFAQAKKPLINVLIVDGQNNHDQWPKITYMMKRYLEETGKFSVDVQRSYYTWNGGDLVEKYKIQGVPTTQSLPKPKMDSAFHPDFSKYDVVINNFGWNAAPWSDATQADFEKFIQNGGGLVVIHAADNSFQQWPAYNRMIGLGGWGDRTEKDGPYVYYDQDGKLVRDNSVGKAGSHGAQKEFLITIRNANHPITKGMPLNWMHTKDEMYDRLRGPAEQMDVLATAFSSKDNHGTGRNEPMLMTIKMGKGRIFHTPLGHVDYSVECVGFITCLQRGTQWAATGKVDIPVPGDFPTENAVSQRKFVDNP